MWLTPTGTVGICKKGGTLFRFLEIHPEKKIICKELLNNYIIELNNEILPVHIAGGFTKRAITGYLSMPVIWYPLFGQLYVLANHLRIDCSNLTAAIESLNEVSYFLLILYRILATFLNYDSSLAQAARAVVEKSFLWSYFLRTPGQQMDDCSPSKKAISNNLLKCVIFSTFAT